MLRSLWKRLGRQALSGAGLLTVANLVQAQIDVPPLRAPVLVPVAATPTPQSVKSFPASFGAPLPAESSKTSGIVPGRTSELSPLRSSDDDLKARVERQEKQIQELTEALKALLARSTTTTGMPVNVPTVNAPPVNATPVSTAKEANQGSGSSQANLSPQDVRQIIIGYLSDKEQQTKAAETAKKREQEERGFTVGNSLGMTAYWNNGLWTETADKAFKIHVGGRTQWDYVGYRTDQNVQFGKGGTGPVKDGVNPRRARLEVDGTLWEVIDFFAEYEFLGNTFNAAPTLPATAKSVVNTPGPTDLWATITHLPVLGNVRVGSMKPPISLEHLTSSRWLDFLERSFAFDTYIGGVNNGFQPGIMMFNWSDDERVTWAVGLFKNNQTVLGWNVGGGEWDVTGRLTWLPWYEDNGRYLMHLGLGASNRGLDDAVARLRARTLLRNGPFTLQTVLADVTVGGDSQTVIVPEFALIMGPWMLQAEYFGSWVTNTTLPAITGKNFGTTYTQSAYVQTSYFLTGENRPWLKKGWSGSAPDRVIPNRNFFFVPGESNRLFSAGAWQVAARFSWIDLNDTSLQAGSLYDVTLGLNWFLNPNMKFQWNLDWAYRNAAGNTSDGPLYGFGMRFAMDF